MPVVDLDRASVFYSAVLGIPLHKETFDGVSIGVFAHDEGNGGCLVPKEAETSGSAGILVYFNDNGRIRDAVQQVEAHGGIVDKPIHAIGPHGFRAIVVDSEGNRIALHSTVDS